MLLKLLYIAGVLSSALGHGRLYWPPSRSTMWRHGFDNPPNYTDQELFCGGYAIQWDQNGGKCGECGDAWHIPVGQRDNQAGGIYANGIIVDTYKPGQEIDIEVQITANHWGWFEFRLCPNNDPTKAVTQDCLDGNLLELADGSGTRWTLPDQSYGMKYIKVRLPAGLTCTQCVLQWRYNTANRWNCDDDGNCCNGCGPQEQFYGCADIAINGGEVTNPSTTTAQPDTTTAQPATTTAQPATTTQAQATTTTEAPAGSTTTTAAPTAGPTTPPAGGNCKATGDWEGQPDKDAWCQENCNHVPPNCSPEMCICS